MEIAFRLELLVELRDQALELAVRGRRLQLLRRRLSELAVLRPFVSEEDDRLGEVERGECGIDGHGDVERAEACDVLVRGFDVQVHAADANEIADLDQRGLLDSTLVMVTSEFGRTPKINENAGRDHWARVYSYALAGGGIKRGQIYGASNATASEPDSDPVTVEDYLATVYHQLGINAEDRLMAPGGRPIDIVRGGKVVEGLIG